MRSIILRPGESLTIGDTVISAESSDFKSGLRPSAPKGAFSKSTFTDLPVLDDLRPILIEILAKGVRQSDVARYIGMTRAGVSDALNGDTPTWMPIFSNGVRLIQMHREVCGKGGDDA